MQLIYRGQSFEMTTRSQQSYTQPHAINWRYALPGEINQPQSVPTSCYRSPKAINWRWLPPI
jgi:hypothetical protein